MCNNMAEFAGLSGFWQSFTEMRKVLLRNIKILGLIMIPLTYQIIAVEFFVEEESSSACNSSGRCLHTMYEIINGTRTKITRVTPYFQIDFEKYGTVLVTTHYIGILLGVLTLGTAADRYGRRKILFISLAFLFMGSLFSAVYIRSMPVFIPVRIIAGYSLGGSLLTLFALVAECVNPGQRPFVLTIIWLASTLSCTSFAGLAYVIHSRRILMITITLPLVLMLFLCIIVPESPRWVLLQSLPSTTTPKTSDQNDDDDESKTLLHRFVSETHSSQKTSFSLWSCGRQSNERKCCGFLKRKEMCRTVVVLGLTWFAIGMLYRGIDTSSIQLLSNFYSNYAVRELVNLLSYAFAVVLVTCAGRRLTTFLGLILSGVVCVIFSFASNGFLLSEHGTVTIVVQFVGRFFVVLSITSLTLFSIELFPTIIRCTALGLVISTSFLGAALTPLIMDLQNINPTIPLAILGCFSIIVAVLLRIFLPETKGSLTAETLEDTVVGRKEPYNEAWSPKINMSRRTSADDEVDAETIQVSLTKPVHIQKNKERYKDLGASWEVSFDKASNASRWEWLSYEDAKRKISSPDIELSLKGESQLLGTEDREKLNRHVPGTSWILLYSTYEHGISMKTLYHRMEGVETPVLLAIKDSQDYIFGVFSPVPPQIHPGFYGYGKSYLFTTKPQFKIFPCSGKNAYYLSCDTESLAFGCSDGLFGLWLDSDLYRGRSTACETFNSEVLSSKEDFLIMGLEVWTFS